MGIYNIDGDRIDSAVVNLANYGDLSTAAGFEAAYNSALADSAIDGISIPYGSYDTEHTLLVRSRFKIYGNNATLHVRASNIHAFNIIGNNNVLIDGLDISMHQSKSTTSGNAFHIVDSNNITIRDLGIYGIGVRGIFAYNTDMTSATSGNSRLTFENLIIRAIGQPNSSQPEWPYGMLLVNVRHTIVRKCWVRGAIRASIALKNYTNNCFVYDNIVEGSKHGLALGSDINDGTKVSSDVFFSRNIVKGSDHPLWIGETERINVFENSLRGGSMFIQRVSDGVFNSNVFDNTDTESDHLLYIDECDNLMIDSNIYNVNEDSELFDIENNPTNVYVGGLFDGRKIDIMNPTSGTPN